jgi:anaerobic magnesium-protoporphyrin IX monomethyl ester cyclase
MRTTIRDVLFVFPPAPGNVSAFNNHLGVAYLRAALAREGMATAQYVNKAPGTIDAVAADIVRQKCPIVGFTVYESNARLSIALAQSIKQHNRSVHVVFGGPAATYNAQALMDRHSAIDACVMGEAEETGAQIFGKLLDSGAFDKTEPGVSFRRDGKLICTPLPPLVGAGQPGGLDILPSPYFSGILTDGQQGVLTSRGCTHHCQYCCFAALGRNSLRVHSIDRVITELEYVAAHQRRTGQRYPVAVQDDTFTLLPTRAKTLCQVIADRKLNLSLSCITRADKVDEELIRVMRDAGFFSVAFGLESAVPSVLRAAGKVRPPDWHDPDLEPEREFVRQVRNSVLLAKRYGLKVGLSIILGLPTETPADGAETLRFVKELPVDSYVHNFVWVFPGTPLSATCHNYGISSTLDKTGLPITTASYNLNRINPASRCTLEEEAGLIRLLAADALSGCNASPTVMGIRSVVISAGQLSAEVATWLGRILTVGGTVVQLYPGTTSGKCRPMLHRDRAILNEHLVPFRHYVQIKPKKVTANCGIQSWEIARAGLDVYREHRPELLSIKTSENATPLISWAKGHAPRATVCEIAGYLQQPRDLYLLMNRIEREDASALLQRMPVPPQVKHSCRWLPGRQPCSPLTRIEVSRSGDVRTCRHGEPIGKVGDSLMALSKQLRRLARAAAQRRGCAKCGNTHCPRCPFPGVEDRTYCQIMRGQSRALRLLDWSQLYSRLPLLVALQKAN